MKLGLIGCGYWGPNYIKAFNKIEGSSIDIVCDNDKSKLESISDIKTTTNLDDVLLNKSIEAVIIATPAITHFNLCKTAMVYNKHVLVEKPLTTSLEEAIELRERAKHMKKVLMVGQIFEYSNSIAKIKDIIRANKLGDIYYAYSQRTNDGPVRKDVGASWDLALHEVSIFNYIFDDIPVSVSAKGLKYVSKKVEDVCFIQLTYPNKVIVKIHCGWLYPRKIRTIDIIGSKNSLMFDDTNTTSPIVLQHGGAVDVEPNNALVRECFEFIDAIEDGAIDIWALERGIDCVNVLGAIQLSLKLNGTEVNL